MSRITTILALVLLAGACTPTEPPPESSPDPAPVAAAEGTGEPAAEGTAEPAAAGDGVDPDDAMSAPAILSVSADAEGTFYLDGQRRDESLPAIGLEVGAGWHYAQVMYEGGRLLSAPRPAHLEPGRRVAVRVVTPFDEATHAAAMEGSGAVALPPELDPVVFEFPPPPPADGSGEEADATELDAAADAEPGDGSGEGSGSQAPPLPFPAGRAAVVVTSDPPGELFIEGYATGLHTPVNVHIPPGTYRFQIVHDGGATLSRNLSAGIAPHAIRRVSFFGTADFIVR